ncbi:MAG TPA: CBASS oligonucleotide cyclase [Acidimicrobiales bacterium]|nr:CBASS oligonucleotide cyclase [Acidimicrobiales bacterium]
MSTNVTGYVTHETLVRFAESRVNLPKAEVDEHRAQVQRLRDHLDRVIADHEHYKLIKTLHSGSVAKGTALRSVSDMDVAAYLDASQVSAGEDNKLIAELASILRKAYGSTKAADDFEEQAHSVKVHFHGSGLDVDVAPIVYAGLPDDRGDLITKDGVRVETSVRLHREFIRARKKTYGRDYAQVVRFLKYWARQQRRDRGQSFRCKSFLLELLVAHLADGGNPLTDYPVALETVFAWIVRTEFTERIWFDDYCTAADLPTSDKSPILVYDPVNPKNNVCKTYTTGDRDMLLDAAADALDAITAARYGTTKSYTVECWQRVFGPTFRGD